MTIAKTVTATANVSTNLCVLFGVNVAAQHPDLPTPPPNAPLVVDIHDSSLIDGSGTLVAKIILNNVSPDSKQIIFPAGVRCGNGISVVITAVGWGDISVSVDYS